MILGFFHLLLYHVPHIVYFADLKLNFSGLQCGRLIEIFFYSGFAAEQKQISVCYSCHGENPLLGLL